MKPFKIAVLSISSWLALHPTLLAESTLCAVVKLQISQEATLEREAFDANLEINNALPDKPLTDLKVEISITDSLGNPADGLFFIKVNLLEGVAAVDGTGVVQPASTADIHWLIIPSTGAGGANPLGQKYAIKAVINALSGTDPQTVTTFDAFITVKPQPVLKLEYALPFDVFGDEPLTAPVETPEPFDLAVRVTNVGFGPAVNFQIESSQPKILDNKLALPLNVQILGTSVNGVAKPNSLLIPFGTLNPGNAGIASWVMSTNLSGRFDEFTSSFTHAAELGGQLTSLIRSVVTSTLLRKVKVELPDRDDALDLLVSTGADRVALQTYLNDGNALMADTVLESDQPIPTPVVSVASELSGALGGPSVALTLSLLNPVAPGTLIHTAVPYPYSGIVPISAFRADGKAIDSSNFWISKHFNKNSMATIYQLNLFDLASSATYYTLNFNPGTVDFPPASVTDLFVSTSAQPGQITVNWTAPGEDGYAGPIFGGRFLIQMERDPIAIFAPALAGVQFPANSSAGDSKSFQFSNLAGNASYFLHLWTEDTGGAVSSLSNRATSYIDPAPPASATVVSVTTSSISGTWTPGNNWDPIEYVIGLSTNPALAPIREKSYAPLNNNFEFSDLPSNTTYFISGYSRNPVTPAVSQIRILASTVTPVSPVIVVVDTTPPVVVISTPSYGNIVLSTIAISGTAFDDVELVSVDIQIDTGPFVPAAFVPTVGLSTWTYILDTFTLANGSHTLTARATDSSTNTAAVSIIIDVQNAPPPPPPDISPPIVAISTPADGAVLSSAAVITGTAFDDRSLSSVSVQIDTGAFSPAVGLSSWTYLLDTFILANGSHTVTVQAVDLSTNIAISSITIVVQNAPIVVVDTTPPMVVISTPANGDVVSSTIAISGTAFDDVELVSVDIQIDTGPFVPAAFVLTVGLSTWTYILDTFTLANGSHTITARATDSSTNTAAVSIVVDVQNAPPPPPDDTPPAIVILSPINGAILVNPVTVSGTASDASGVNSVEIQIDTQPFTLANGTTSWSYVLNVPELSVGTHTITALATDMFGNNRSTSIVVEAVLNLVGNPGFESGTINWTFPGTASIDNAVVHGGSASAKIFHPVISDSNIASIQFVVEPRAVYRAAIWIQWENIQIKKINSGAQASIQWLNASGKVVGTSMLASGLIGTQGWTQFEGTFIAPAKAARARVILKMLKARGAAWFDDAMIAKTSNAQALAMGAPPIEAESSYSEESDFAILEPSADPAFRQGEIYSFPNPAKNGRKPTLHVECGIADAVEIRIYDIAGELLNEAHLNGIPQIVNGKYAYEYTWDLAGAGSGVYLYVVAAKKAGEPDIRVRGKLAVIQ